MPVNGQVINVLTEAQLLYELKLIILPFQKIEANIL